MPKQKALKIGPMAARLALDNLKTIADPTLVTPHLQQRFKVNADILLEFIRQFEGANPAKV